MRARVQNDYKRDAWNGNAECNKKRNTQYSWLSVLTIKCSHCRAFSLLSALSLKLKKYAMSPSPVTSLWGPNRALVALDKDNGKGVPGTE